MIIAVEGNIGAGKSTFLSAIRSNLPDVDGRPVIVLPEKVDEWMNLVDPASGKSIFDLFYSDPKKYAYVFQTYVLLSRIQHLSKTVRENGDAIIVCERGCMTDCVVFAKSMHDEGILTDMEWTVYQAWHEAACASAPVDVDGQVYLRASPRVCSERIRRRARAAEADISDDYVSALHDRHEAWLMADPPAIPTHVVEADADGPHDISLLRDFIRRISSRAS
jgi:deoxyadenosine/deoxycytidine kinase